MQSLSFSTEYIAMNTKLDELKEHGRTVGRKGISGKRKRELVEVIIKHHEAKQSNTPE